MSAADSEAAVERLAAIRSDLGVEGFAKFAFLALGILAYNAPGVAEVVFTQAQELSA